MEKKFGGLESCITFGTLLTEGDGCRRKTAASVLRGWRELEVEKE
jgi:hypothetical protein